MERFLYDNDHFMDMVYGGVYVPNEEHNLDHPPNDQTSNNVVVSYDDIDLPGNTHPSINHNAATPGGHHQSQINGDHPGMNGFQAQEDSVDASSQSHQQAEENTTGGHAYLGMHANTHVNGAHDDAALDADSELQLSLAGVGYQFD